MQKFAGSSVRSADPNVLRVPAGGLLRTTTTAAPTQRSESTVSHQPPGASGSSPFSAAKLDTARATPAPELPCTRRRGTPAGRPVDVDAPDAMEL